MAFRFVTLFLALHAAFGQDYRAKLQGIDSTDASVAGANITIRNLGTGITATRVSGAARAAK